MNLPLDQQVCNKELSQRLRELGVPQESLWWWHEDAWQFGLQYEGWSLWTGREDFSEGKKTVSAFTVSELGMMLPWEIKLSESDEVFFASSKDEDDWAIWYEGLDKRGREFKWESHIDKTEANARALVLKWLIENKHLDVKDL